MDSPPRHDEWVPLASQQLRLRHLTRIIGLNILCSDRCKLYFTLHHKLDCAPFYTSASIQHCSSSEAVLWDNILCPEIYKSNARAVCVRVWEQSSKKCDVPDKSLFSWLVSFSGLILTGSCNDAKRFSNILIFQLKTNCFSSAEHFSSFSLDNNECTYDNLYDYDKHAIKSHSSESREVSDGNGTREITQNETKSKCVSDSTNDLGGIRCLTVQRPRSSTRQSYNLEKLLRVQKLQRNCKRLREDLHDITDQIVNHNLRHKSNAPKGRSIDYLLADFEQTSPEAKIESKELRKKIEALRFKCNLLERERELCSVRNQELINQLRIKRETRDNRRVALREDHTWLCDDKSVLYKRIKVILNGVKTKKDLEQKIHKRLSLLCSELKHIYPINKNSRGCFTVSSIPFPDKDYLSSNPLQADQMKIMTPAALSVTLGFVAHLVQITAIILDKPLRYPLPNKPSIPPKQILYGIYLLNQNIAQLNYDIFGMRLDPRATIENFLKLFCSIIKTGQDESDGELTILYDVSRIEDFSKARSSIDPNRLQVERMPLRTTLANEEKRYHSEDDLKTLAEHCLKQSYSQERVDQE